MIMENDKMRSEIADYSRLMTQYFKEYSTLEKKY